MADLNIEEILNQITGNSELMEKISQISKSGDGSISDKLPEVIKVIAPSIDEENKSTTNENTATPEDKSSPKNESSPTHLPFQIDRITETISKNSKLLVALKPYLSKERSDIIDSIVKMAQVADLMKHVK